MPLQCSSSSVGCQANWKLVVMWVDDKPVDDGCRSLFIWCCYKKFIYLNCGLKRSLKEKKTAMIIHFQLRFNPQFKYINFMCQHHLTNRFHVAVRLFSNKSQSQMTSKCAKNKKEAHEAIAECVTYVLNTFWRLLWSITEQTHGKIESICFMQ